MFTFENRYYSPNRPPFLSYDEGSARSAETFYIKNLTKLNFPRWKSPIVAKSSPPIFLTNIIGHVIHLFDNRSPRSSPKKFRVERSSHVFLLLENRLFQRDRPQTFRVKISEVMCFYCSKMDHCIKIATQKTCKISKAARVARTFIKK